MGIFRRATRGRHGSAEAASSAADFELGFEPDFDLGFEPDLELGRKLGFDTASESDFAHDSVPSSFGAEIESAVDIVAAPAPAPSALPPEAALRPSGLTPDAVVASFAADAERFVATFPYAASPVPEGGLDFTRASLVHVEALLSALHVAGRPLPERLQQSVAVYLFETARREFGGRYLRFESPDPIILLVGEPRAQVGICAMSRVASRVEHGPDDSIIHFYASISPLIAEGAEITLR